MSAKCKTLAGFVATGVLALPLTAQAMARPERILRSDQPLTGLNARAGQRLAFRVWVLAGSRELRVRTSGGRGDLDLYLRHAARPGRDRYESDNKRDRASTISAHERQTRTIYPDEDEDWVRFVPAHRGRYLLRVGPSTTPLKAEVWIGRHDGKEKRVEKVKFPRAGGSVLLEAGRGVRYYKFKVEAQDDDDTGLYHLTVLPVR